MIKIYSVLLISLFLGLVTTQILTEKCLSCLRQHKEGTEDCRMTWTDTFCGKYVMSKGFWEAGGYRGLSFEACASDDDCAADTMRIFFRRFGERCAKQLNKETYQLTCADYIRLHNGGADGCSRSDTLADSKSIEGCMSY